MRLYLAVCIILASCSMPVFKAQASIIGLLYGSKSSPVKISVALENGKVVATVVQTKGLDCDLTVYRHKPDELEKDSGEEITKEEQTQEPYIAFNLWEERKCLEKTMDKDKSNDPPFVENKTSKISVTDLLSKPILARFKADVLAGKVKVIFLLQEYQGYESGPANSEPFFFPDVTEEELVVYRSDMDDYNAPVSKSQLPIAEEIELLKPADLQARASELPSVQKNGQRVKPLKAATFVKVKKELWLDKTKSGFSTPSQGRYDFIYSEGKMISSEERNKLDEANKSGTGYCSFATYGETESVQFNIEPQIIRAWTVWNSGGRLDDESNLLEDIASMQLVTDQKSTKPQIVALGCTALSKGAKLTVADVYRHFGPDNIELLTTNP